MEFAVLLKPMNGSKYRATCAAPFYSEAEGETREQALEQLRQQIQEQVDDGTEIVQMKINSPTPTPQLPLWPDDEITQEWLRAIDEVRREANIKEGIEVNNP